jgi:hypothetical protein
MMLTGKQLLTVLGTLSNQLKNQQYCLNLTEIITAIYTVQYLYIT